VKIALVGLRLSVGPRLIVDTLGPALQQLGVDVVFVGERSYTPPDGIPVRAIADGGSYGAMLRETFQPSFYRRAIDVLVDESPDVCYFVSSHPANGPLAMAVRRSVRNPDNGPSPVAMHIHDPVPHPGASSLAIFATQLFGVRAADYVVTYGGTLAQQLQRWYGLARQKILTIRHGASRPPREAPPPMAHTYRHFSFLGRIQGYKGLDVFLEAARRVAQTHPKARFYIGGAGDLEPYEKAIAALGDKVTVENRELTNEETDDVMQDSWAVVLPYRSATQSGVVPVAYWNGCPVIVTRVGGLGEVVREGETGFIVRRGSAEQVAERMRQLQGDRALRYHLGNGAFSFYDRWLRWERIAHDLMRPFRPVLEPVD
jgi:starch synthase